MFDAKHLDYVGRLYDLTLNGEGWYGGLTEFCGFIGAGAAALQLVDPLQDDAYMSEYGRAIDRLSLNEIIRNYNEKWADYDAQALIDLFHRPERAFRHDFEIICLSTMEEIETHPPIVWSQQHLGTFWRVASRLNTSDAWMDVIAFSFPRAHGPMSEAEKAFAMPFLPHFAKVVEIRRAFTVLEARFRAVLDALDRFNIGVFITLGSGVIVVGNREADRILDLGDGIGKGAGGVLNLSEEALRLRLVAAIADTTATAGGAGTREEVLIDVDRPSGARPFLMTVSPLRDDRHRIDRRFRGALVFVIDPENRKTLSTAGLARVFALTPAETEVLGHLLDGASTGEIAERRSTAPDTVRNQIKSILAKTHTGGRAELIRLAVSVDLPIDRQVESP